MAEYVTIAAFAKLAGVSRQAVYSRLDSQDLDKFIQVDNTGKKPKKLVSTEALQLFKTRTVNQVDCKVDTVSDKQLDTMQEQLKEKDKTITSLLEQVQQLQTQNQSLSNSLSDQGKELTKLLDQQQQLQAMYAKQLTLAAASEENKAPKAPAEEEQPKEVEPEPKKKGFFKRIFKL